MKASGAEHLRQALQRAENELDMLRQSPVGKCVAKLRAPDAPFSSLLCLQDDGKNRHGRSACFCCSKPYGHQNITDIALYVVKATTAVLVVSLRDYMNIG